MAELITMTWTFEYTTHLGYEPPTFRPQFADTVGSDDVTAHAAYAAELGMAGILYPWALERPPEEVDLVRTALGENGLRASTVVSMPFGLIMAGLWTRSDATSVAQLGEAVRGSASLAASLGSDLLAALVVVDPDPDAPGPARQRDNAAANFRAMAAVAGGEGVQIAIEPMNAIPGQLLASMVDAAGFVREVDDDRVGLIFDTGHVVSTDGDLFAPLEASYDHVKLVQFADLPGRVEPGAGDLPLVSFGAELLRRGYRGLVDLEHGWSEPDAAGEQAGLDRLRRFDESIRRTTTVVS